MARMFHITLLLTAVLTVNAYHDHEFESVRVSLARSHCGRSGGCSRLRLVAPCPTAICGPQQSSTTTTVVETTRHVQPAARIVEKVHRSSSYTSKFHQKTEKIVQEPIVQQRVERIVQEPIVQQRIERIVQEPIVQQRVERIVQEPIVQQRIERIVQEPIVQQRIERIVQEPIVQQRIEKIVQEPVKSAPIVQQRIEKIVQEPIVVQQKFEKIVQEPVKTLPIVHRRVEKIVQAPIKAAAIVEHHRTTERIVQAPVVHRHYEKRVEKIVQQPIVQQKIEKIVQEPIVQQRIEKIVQEPIKVEQHYEQKVQRIVQEPVVVQQRVERIVQHPVKVHQTFEKIIQEPLHQQTTVHHEETVTVHRKPTPVVSLRITACPEGHFLSEDGTHCKHIDCEAGFRFDDRLLACVDVDECATPTACHSDEQCINTHGSYKCRKICTAVGFRLNEAINQCVDINECLEGLHTCGSQQTCTNTPGSYKCSCPTGYRLSGSNCIDIDECTESHDHLCQYDTSVCVNTAGSYACQCRPGFQKDSSGRCIDIDECLINNGGCSHKCVNKYGSYECHCGQGFKLGSDSHTCEDIDECSLYSESGICSPQTATCQNTVGSYKCRCKTGFYDPEGSGKHCVDLNECENGQNLCEQKCINAYGSYKCQCNRGYRLVDAFRCEDIDECHEGDVINQIAYSRFRHADDAHPKLCQGSCVNSAGSYRCACPHGYNLVHNHHCVDIDECSEHGYCRGSNQTCVNIGGSFRCIEDRCPPGYHRDGTQCKISERLNYADICDDPTEVCDIDRVICYSYAYIALRARMINNSTDYGRRGHEFFTFVVPVSAPIIVDFKMRLVSVKSPRAHVTPAQKNDFEMRRTKDNEIRVALLSSLSGPQDIELEIEAKMYKNGVQIGKNLAIVTVFISEYDF